MAFVERMITVDFSLGGQGASTPLSNMSFTGLRTSARILVANAHTVTATVQIYGLSLSHMNALSKVTWKPTKLGANTVRIQAGDKINGMSTVFEGTIIQCWPDMQSAPEVFLRVDAKTGSFDAVKPIESTSFSGPTDVATAFKTVVGKMAGVQFEDNAVKMMIDSPYLWGTARNQLALLGKMTRVGWIQELGKVAIWPQNGSRTTAGGATDISKETGMVSYPYASPGALVVKTLFNRAIAYATKMNVKSDIELANGSWTVTKIELDLEALMPKGKWFATLYGVPNG